MKSAIIKKTLCLILAAGTVFSCAGCTIGGKSTSKKKSSKNSDLEIVEFDNKRQENGTAVVTHRRKNAEGKTELVTESVFVEDVGVPNYTSEKIDVEKIKKYGEKIYGMKDSDIQNIVKNQEKWEKFSVLKYIQNNNDSAIVIMPVKTEDNGKDGIWIETSLDGEIGLQSGNVTAIYINGIVDSSKYDTDEALKTAFDSLNISLVYTISTNEFNEVESWDKAKTYEMAIG